MMQGIGVSNQDSLSMSVMAIDQLQVPKKYCFIFLKNSFERADSESGFYFIMR